jgi:hypothetical protein
LQLPSPGISTQTDFSVFLVRNEKNSLPYRAGPRAKKGTISGGLPSRD